MDKQQIESDIRDAMDWIKRSVDATSINKSSLRGMIDQVRLYVDRVEFNTNQLQ